MHRKINGYTQTQVAQILGLSSAIPLSQWEHGIHRPNLEHLLALSIIYHTLISELYFEQYQIIRKQLRLKDTSSDTKAHLSDTL